MLVLVLVIHLVLVLCQQIVKQTLVTQDACSRGGEDLRIYFISSLVEKGKSVKIRHIVPHPDSTVHSHGHNSEIGCRRASSYVLL